MSRNSSGKDNFFTANGATSTKDASSANDASSKLIGPKKRDRIKSICKEALEELEVIEDTALENREALRLQSEKLEREITLKKLKEQLKSLED